MEIGGFEFTVSEMDGCRVIESRYPKQIDLTKLSSVIASYYDLWDDRIPTAALTDISDLDALTPEVRQILKSVIQRTVLQSTFLGSAWYAGPRYTIAEDLRQILRDAGRPDNNVFEDHEGARAYVQSLIRAHATP